MVTSPTAISVQRVFFDYVTIVKNYAYGSNSDKAFAISGNVS